MSIFGKILAILNVLAIVGALFLIGRDYAKRRTWEYAVFRQDLMMNGLPLDEEETDERGRPLFETVGPLVPSEKEPATRTQKELFGGRDLIATQKAEVERVQNALQSKIQGAGDKKKQISLYARVLTPLALTNEQRQQAISYQTYLKDDASYKRLQDLFAYADKEAKRPPAKDQRAKPYDEAFTEALTLRYTDPPGSLAEAFLAVKKTDPNATVEKALEQSLDPQLAQLQGQFEQAFREAKEIKPKSKIYNKDVKADAPSERKRIIAHLLFNMVDVLPDDAAGAAAPKLDLTANENYKRFVAVVGVRAAVVAVNDQAALLRDMAAEAAVQRLRERGIFAVEHRKATGLIQDKTVQVEMHGLLLARKQKELADHEADLVRRRKNVKDYQEELAEAREQTAKHLKELRDMSDVLYKKSVELRDDTMGNQQREKKIRALEYGRE